MSLRNRYHLRRVAESSARACFICYKPSSSVLITPDNRDFFYVCPIHLKDKGFCTPIEDEESAGMSAAEKKRKEELEKEIELVKKEYEEKVKKKKGKDKKKDGSGEGEDDKKKGKNDDDDDDSGEAKKAEKEKDEKIKSLQTNSASAASTTTNDDDTPRIYTLHKTFYQMRVDRLRNIEMAKRNRERMKDSSFFPSAPQSDVS